MNLDEFVADFSVQEEEIKRFIRDDLPDMMGIEAVQHFQENFDKEGFVDNGLQPWQEVERGKPESPWYGFSPENKKQFSSTRAADKILKDSGDLQDSITYDKEDGSVIVSSDLPYAQVHNEGGDAMVFGRKAFKMPERRFIGHSKELDDKIMEVMTEEIGRIIGVE